MTAPDRDHWILTIRLPHDAGTPDVFMRRLLKHLLRSWGCRCVAIQESEELARLRAEVEQLRKEKHSA
jgi:hypothetical protein